MKLKKISRIGFDSSSAMKRRIVIYSSAVLLLIGGIWGAKESGTRTDARMRLDLARQVMALAATFPADEVQALSFTRNDERLSEFRQLGTRLKAYFETTGLRGVFTTALRDGQLLFGPESYDPDDPFARRREPFICNRRKNFWRSFRPKNQMFMDLIRMSTECLSPQPLRSLIRARVRFC